MRGCYEVVPNVFRPHVQEKGRSCFVHVVISGFAYIASTLSIEVQCGDTVKASHVYVCILMISYFEMIY